MAEDRLAELRRFNPHSETHTVEARCFPAKEGEPPEWVIIEGRVYRAEDDQTHHRLALQENDMHREFLDRYGLEAFDALFGIITVSEQDRDHERKEHERKLLDLLPNHEPVIRSVFNPDECPLGALEWARHRACRIG